MISVRGPKMKGRKSLLMRVFIISGLGALLSGRNNVTCRTSSRVTVLRLKGSSMGVRSTLISSGITMLFFLARRTEASAAFLPTAAKNWLNSFATDFRSFEQICLALILKGRARFIIFQRTGIFLMQSHHFEGVVSLSFK